MNMKVLWCVVCFAGATVGCNASEPSKAPEPIQEKSSKVPEAPKTKSSAPEPSSPAKLSGLSATLNGKPIPLKTGLSYSEGGSALTMVFSTATPKCEDFAQNGRLLADDEVYFTTTLAPMLRKDGSTSMGLSNVYFDSNTRTGSKLGTVSIERADPKKGVKGELGLELHVKASTFLKKPEQNLVVKGEFETVGCGVVAKPKKEGVAPRPQKDLQLKIAGQSFDVTGAVVKPSTFPSQGYDLLLTTSPIGCDSSSHSDDAHVKLHFAKDKAVTFIYMRGTVFESQYNASVSKEKAGMTVAAEGSLEGEGEVTLKLSGEEDVLGYKVGVEGEVRALRCPK